MFVQLVAVSLVPLAIFVSASPSTTSTAEIFVGTPTVEPAVVEASGLTPEGEVLWAWVERVGRGAYSETRSGREVLTADVEGVSVLDRPEGIPLRSIFVVLDVETGEQAVGAPDDYEPLTVSLPPGAVVAGDASRGQGPRLAFSHRMPEVLVLRPGKRPQDPPGNGPKMGGPPERGAWLGRAVDGGDDDEDGEANGRVDFAVERMHPVLGEAGPPERLRGRDVVVMLDLEELALLSTDLEGRVPADDPDGEGEGGQP